MLRFYTASQIVLKNGLYLIPFLYHSHKKTRKEQEQEPSYN